MPPNLPPFKVSLQAMSWETLILPLNLGVTRTSTIVHATTSYWESACPSFMRHGGSPQVNGNFRLLSHDHRLVVRALFQRGGGIGLGQRVAKGYYWR
ncbi:hypothetical protein PGTUg99_004918 [Puccinia graminis f. sp. tritici]|uniref:Uncharacterized protein n=1 Tax=Puccinia graminis f. sp. tritici TaxID=56615 RepID=A0A5B0Q0S9_PUCGR|nr:hypothetical protein PGTUg99_004918 [Puccinia graminis f. sp. tritici]